jgi:hypothetical protein
MATKGEKRDKVVNENLKRMNACDGCTHPRWNHVPDCIHLLDSVGKYCKCKEFKESK